MSKPTICLTYKGFTKLPGEIRNKIYAHIAHDWARTINVTHARTTPLTRRSSSPDDTASTPLLRNLPGIVYTNHQLYEELLPLLVEKTRFTIHSMQDIAYLDTFLLDTDTHEQVQQLSFPRYSLMLEESNDADQDVAFSACNGLRDLAITVNTESLIPFIGRSAQNEHDMAVDLPRLAHAWGLDLLWGLPHLERFRMECRVGPGQGMLIPMFNALAELLFVGWEGGLDGGVKKVGRQSVSLRGVRGLCDLVVFVFKIVRN